MRAETRTRSQSFGAGLLLAALLATPAELGAGGTGATALLTPQGSDAGTANGDFISADPGGLDTFYRYFIEVPPGIARLEVEVFDADVGAGGGGEAAAGRDRARGSFDSTATYTLLDPAGVARPTRFTTGNAAGPAGANNAWLDLYNATGNSVRDNFGAASYGNDDGTGTWAGNWIEVDSGGAGPAAGAVRITGGELRLQDGVQGTPSLQREADLLGSPGLDLVAAFLSFDFRTSNTLENNDEIRVEVSGNGGGSWTTLETFSNDGSGSRTYDVTAFIANNTRVRFVLDGGYADADEFFFVDDLQITDGVKTAGHWELRVDMSSAVTGGDDINAIGLRAHDGAAGSGGTELDVYYDSHNQVGVNPPDEDTASRSYDLFPYVSSGCSFSKNDFDYDSNSGTTGSIALSSRAGAFTQSFGSAALSANNVWRRDTVTGWATDAAAVDYGVWSADVTVTSYLVNGTPNGNYANLWFGSFQAAANPPAANPTANAFRVYLSADAGAAPVKPYVEQLLTHVSGSNPPVANQTSRVSVTVRVVNPTAQAITFSTPSNLVTANVPGGGVVYAGSAQATAGTTIVGQPSIGGTGNVTWSPGTLAAGATAILAYRVDVTPAAAGQRVPVTATPASGAGTRAQFVDGTGNTTQARATFLFGPLCELAVTEALLTEAVVSSFSAEESAGGVVVEWRTASEAGTAGFRLERFDPAAGRYERVGDGLLLGLLSAPQGGTYRFLDAGAAPGEARRYRLVEVETGGAERVHGPFDVVVGPRDDEDQEPETVYSRTPHPARERAAARAASGASGGPALQRAFAAATKKGAEALHVAVREPGLTFLSTAEIAAALDLSPGAAESAVAHGKLSLTHRGRPVAWLPDLDGKRGRGLFFYGEGIDSLYTRDNVYRLERGKGPTMQSARVGGAPAPADGAFAERLHLERDATPVTVVALDPESDYWFWDFVQSGDATNGTKAFPLDAPGLAATGGTASLRVGLHGITSTGAAGEHHVAVSLNGTPLGESRWEGIAPHAATFTFAPELLQESANQVEVTGILDAGVSHSIFFVDSFDLAYPRRYRAVGDALRFRGDGNRDVAVVGFTTADVRLFDVSDPLRPRLVEGAVVEADGASGFRLRFSPATPQTPYLAVAAAGVEAPAALRPWRADDLRSSRQRAEYLILTTAELEDAAQRLADHRAAQGLETLVVELDQVMDELNFGIASPHAIRGFLAWARAEWRVPPRYVVLAGKGTLDYRDVFGLGENLLPPLMAPSAGSLFPADNRLADVRGDDGLPEMAIGRIPATTAAELDAYVDKVIAYEAADGGAWAGNALLLADAADRGADFAADTGRVAALLPAGYAVERIDLTSTPLADARASLFDGLARGASLVNYLGHGGLDRLSAAGLLASADVPGLGNGERLPVLTAMTCAVNRFAVPGVPALGERLTLAPGGGAAAVWAPSGLSINAEAVLLAERFYRQTSGPEAGRLGDLVLAALAELRALGGSRSMLDIYNLLGDPALLLKRPAAPAESPGPVSGE